MKSGQKTAFITGLGGQDASYLAELLVSKNYRVTGMLRRHAVSEHQTRWLDRSGIRDRIETFHGDMTSESSLHSILAKIVPDEIYNLAAQSHVHVSWEIPEYTTQVNALGVLRLLEAARKVCPEARIYQASSAEMFGGCSDADGFQRETTSMEPTSPYGCAKLYGYAITRHYRRGFNMFAANGILFNHESPRRASSFVTQKIVKTAVAIDRGEADELFLGNMESQRDWGHSKDYVFAMWLILQQDSADDFVIATGETYSVRDFCEIVFRKLNLDYADFVKQDAGLIRPEELLYLRGDPSKAKRELGWTPEYTFDAMIEEMIEHQQKAGHGVC